MLAWLAEYSGAFGLLNVFRYITFRTVGATGTAMFFVFFFGPTIIAGLRIQLHPLVFQDSGQLYRHFQSC